MDMDMDMGMGMDMGMDARSPRRFDLTSILSPDNLSMIVTPERVVYAGLIGSPLKRTLGSIAIYASIGAPFLIRTAGSDWRTTCFAVIPPYQAHDLVSTDKIVCSLHVEPESIDRTAAAELMAMDGDDQAGAVTCAAFRALVDGKATCAASTPEIDCVFFGTSLPGRSMDPRIARAVAMMQREAHDLACAKGYARLAGVSLSRFVHLFTLEVGTSFRRFRAWKRARSFLSLVRDSGNLTDIALEAGYPDSTHFSHSIRKIYGLRPKDILAGGRRLSVIRLSRAKSSHV
ncbi:helix-turn-helix domain-containing protein [Phreatobacter stygius]|uniref:Helix-turn-helix transcriptional regulator n=1 Tax=Phreatobacter stygius TaxID=1940610 RepID=A0A4D7BFP5_9HYPH|nr:AraC family transcriptional regulator [Phreatobacter stygius]QCI68016.1 helix-turn-helix transcriptional regulator [Phreatobacter stygius]